MPQVRQAEEEWTSGPESGFEDLAVDESDSEYSDADMADEVADEEVANEEVASDLRDLRGDTIDPARPMGSVDFPSWASLPVPQDKLQPGDNKAVQDIEELIRQCDKDNVDPDEGRSVDEELFDGNRAPPELYRQQNRTTNANDFKRRHYSKGTLNLIQNCANYWKSLVSCSLFSQATTDWPFRLCEQVLRSEDDKQCFRAVNFQIIRSLLTWYLNQRKGTDGRNKRPIKAMGSLITFWCCFRLLYERVIPEKIDDILPRNVMTNVCVLVYHLLLHIC